MKPENTGQIQEKGRFTKGKSGNPMGKPKGARSRSALMAERLFADEVESIEMMLAIVRVIAFFG